MSDREDRSLLDKDADRSGTGWSPATQPPRDFEDNLVVPSNPSWKFLKGRCFAGVASGKAAQSLSAEWVYQRFLNSLTHRFFDVRHPWYETRLLGSEVLVGGPTARVTLGFTILAPLLYPLVFGPAALFFLALVPASLVRDFEFLGKITTLELLIVGLKSLWYFWIAIPTWYYLLVLHPHCVMDVHCGDASFHVSGVTLAYPFMACSVSAFNFVHAVAVSACDCACHAQSKNLLRDQKYGNTLREVIRTLANRENKASYYPIYVYGEDEEPESVPTPLIFRCAMVFLCFLHGLLPLVWMWQRHEEEKHLFPLLDAGLWAHALVWTSIVAIGVELYLFFNSLNLAKTEYQHVVDQLFLFIYMGCLTADKRRPHFWKTYSAIAKKNDALRLKNSEVLKCDKYDDKEERFAEQIAKQQESFLAPSAGSKVLDEENPVKVNELELLKIYQVQFDLSTVEGVSLYTRLRRWICTDIINESLEIDLFMTVVFLLIIMELAYLGVSYIFRGKGQGVSAVWTVIPLNLSMLSYYGLSVLNLCVNANLYLFDHYKRILLTWQEFLYLRESDFGPAAAHTSRSVGWRWQEPEGNAPGEGEPLPLVLSSKAPLTEDREAVTKVLELAAKTVDLNERPQQVLGFEVTSRLQSSVLVSLGSTLAALFYNIFSQLAEDPQALEDIANVITSGSLKRKGL